MKMGGLRVPITLATGAFLGGGFGWATGQWLFDDPSVGLGLGLVTGFGLATLIGALLISD